MGPRSEDINADLKATGQLSDYEAVEVLWVALVTAVNRTQGTTEHQRMLALVRRMRVAQVKVVLHHPAVESLLTLDPPLETVLANSYEHLYPEDTKRALDKIRGQRERERGIQERHCSASARSSSGYATRRAHGFKTRNGPRDREILGAASLILLELCELAVEALRGDDTLNAR
jgi:hypothetical protein